MTFKRKKNNSSIQISNDLIYKVYSEFGCDLNNTLLNKDSLRNKKFNATWLSGIGESFMQIDRTENLKTEFHILFANNLLKQYGKKISI